jgi:hypothetical protein
VHDKQSICSLPDWIGHVFDHSIADPAWYWSLDAPAWEGSSEQTITFIAGTFERSGDLLARFTDEQLSQGFSYLVSASCSDFMFALVEPSIPLASRLRALRSFVPLFEQVMAVRCSSHLSHLDEQPANPLDGVCYMWWDIIPIHSEPAKLDRIEFGAEVLEVLPTLLSIPHDACRESALHGLSEWQRYYPKAEALIEDWLARTPGLRPELASYAQRAKVGMVQ